MTYNPDQPRDDHGRFGEGGGGSGQSGNGPTAAHGLLASGKGLGVTAKEFKRFTIDKTASALRARGLTLGKGSFDLGSNSTTYEVTDSVGNRQKLSTAKIL